MRKKMVFEHLDRSLQLAVEFVIEQEGDHWAARLKYLDESQQEVKAPVFYGTTVDQAERQLRKVFEKEYDLVEEHTIEP